MLHIRQHPAALQTSLREVLGPRWALSGNVAGHYQGFNPIHHLTALATLFGKEFLICSILHTNAWCTISEFILHWQQANEHLWVQPCPKV